MSLFEVLNCDKKSVHSSTAENRSKCLITHITQDRLVMLKSYDQNHSQTNRTPKVENLKHPSGHPIISFAKVHLLMEIISIEVNPFGLTVIVTTFTKKKSVMQLL